MTKDRRLHPAPRLRQWFDDRAMNTASEPVRRAIEIVRDGLAGIWHSLAPSSEGRNALLRQLRAIGPLTSANHRDDAPRVLLVTPRNWQLHAGLDLSLSFALRDRGADCMVFFCGEGQHICMMGWPARDGRSPCLDCGPLLAAGTDLTGTASTSLTELVPRDQRAEIEDRIRRSARPEDEVIEGVRIGDALTYSLAWKFRSTAPVGPDVAAAREGFLIGAALIATAAGRLFDQWRPDVVVALNGLFLEERVFCLAARARGIRIATYEGGQRRGTYFWAHGPDRMAADYDISELWAEVRGEPLDDASIVRVEAELRARRDGPGMTQRYFKSTEAPAGGTAARTLAMFTNVAWDSAVLDRHRGFDSMFDWIDAMVDGAERHPDTRLVIRVHPAESRYKLETRTQQPVGDHLLRRPGGLPPNVTVIGADEPTDSYALLDAADGVVVYTSTIGTEAAASGKPVWVCGTPHYGERGFTIDVEGAGQIDEMFQAPSPVGFDGAATADVAKRYLHAFLFRALIPVQAVELIDNRNVQLNYDAPDDPTLLSDAGIQAICDGILEGKPFVVPSTAPQ